MTTGEYEYYVNKKCATPLPCSYLGLAGECGELLDLIKKVDYHGHEEQREKAILELGDILFYLTDIATRRYNVSLEHVMEQNKIKLDKRFKAAFTKEESVNRHD